jgi:RNA polymerase sigma-70 factor (ECF subfamily)
MDSQRQDDAELVAAALDGDRDAFAALVDRYRRPVYALALQRVQQTADAEDVAQEAFVKAYRSLHTLREPLRFASWLYGIAMRCAMDYLRLRGRQPVMSDVVDIYAPAFYENQELRELVETVMSALGELPDAQRLVVTLRYLEGLDPKAIAERLGESRLAVRSRLFKAMQVLRRRLASLV